VTYPVLGESTTAALRDSYCWPFAVSLAATLLFVPMVRWLAVRLDLFDRPDAGLKPHDRPIPCLGGVGMYLGWCAALAVAYAWIEPCRGAVPWVAAAGTLLTLTGVADDLWRLSPKVRLVVQAVAAVLLMYGGVGRKAASALIEPLRTSLPSFAATETVELCFAALVCVFTLAGAMNATNFIDGLDGLCAGIVAIASLGFLAISLTVGHAAGGVDPAGPLRLILCAALLGMCAGLLWYNFNPASIFMGDGGSLLLGFNVAVIMLLLMEQPAHAGYATWRWFDGALIAFAFPVLDTGVAISRRWLNRRPLFVGDRSHLYDQLRDRGLSVRHTVLICYALGGAFALIGALAVRLPAILLFAVLIGIPGVAGYTCRKLGLLKVDDAAIRSTG